MKRLVSECVFDGGAFAEGGSAEGDAPGMLGTERRERDVVLGHQGDAISNSNLVYHVCMVCMYSLSRLNVMLLLELLWSGYVECG